MGVNLIAALWGFAEATLFFIVPDLWLSIVGRDKLRAGLIACVYALLGSLAGGALVYFWGSVDPAGAAFVLEKTPAVSPEMVVRVHEELNDHGGLAIFFGPLSGTPYKLYAAQAADAGINLLPFLWISIPARFIRFVAVTTFCHYALRALKRLGLHVNSLTILLTAWSAFYIVFFAIMPN